MHVTSENNFFCELVLFFPFVLRQLEPWSPSPASTLQRQAGDTDAQHCTWLPCGPRGMNSGCWVFIADSSVFTHSIITLDWSQLAFLDHITLCMLPRPFPIWKTLIFSKSCVFLICRTEFFGKVIPNPLHSNTIFSSWQLINESSFLSYFAGVTSVCWALSVCSSLI